MKDTTKYIVRDVVESEAEVLRLWANRMVPDRQVHREFESAKAASDLLPGSAIYRTTTQMEKLS
jgi:hypothetical protein